MIVVDGSGATLREEPTPAGFPAEGAEKRNAMFRAVFRELANPRAGTASTKRRDEVSGGGRKPWKQKGTGRARQGSTRSPQWTHGGVVFGPKPRSYQTSLNKRERKAAMHAALCDRFAGGCITVLATEKLSLAKTRDMAALVYGAKRKAADATRTLVVYDASEASGAGAAIERAGRNLARVNVTHTGALDVKDVLGHGRLLVTEAALATLRSTFGETA